MLGLRLAAIPAAAVQSLSTAAYRGGLAVTAVRPTARPRGRAFGAATCWWACTIWETVTPENVDYILNRPDFTEFDPMKFYILRTGEGGKVLYGAHGGLGPAHVRQ